MKFFLAALLAAVFADQVQAAGFEKYQELVSLNNDMADFFSLLAMIGLLALLVGVAIENYFKKRKRPEWP